MNEYIYKLNLPSIDKIVNLEKFNELISNEELTTTVVPAEALFNEKFLSIKNFKFNTCVVFLKNNESGKIHSDYHENELGGSVAGWGINWIFNGTGQMEYWNKTNVEPLGDRPGINSKEIRYSEYKEKTPANKIYTLKDSASYLANVSVPHRGSGQGKRYCFSLRPTKSQLILNWQDVCNIFNDLIIPQ